MAALFWPDEPETVAKKNLRQSLYQLRQVLGEAVSQEEPYLLVTRSTIQFNAASDHSLDVADFLDALENDHLEQAVTLYQGDLLPGFTCDSLPFEEWLRVERERLHRLAMDALFELTSPQSFEGRLPGRPKAWPNGNWPWNHGAKKRIDSSCRRWPCLANAVRPWHSMKPVGRCSKMN